MDMPRLITAMITPYDNELEVNYQKAAELVEHLIGNGSEGIVVCGTTGESPVLTREEKLQLYSVVKETANGRIPIWAGTGSNDTRQTVELSREAEKLGVDGIMLVTPYYNKPSQQGLYEHFKTIAEAVALPVMLYNVPGRTSSNLQPVTVARLAEVENIKAIKEACGDMDQVSELIRLLQDRLTVYSGDDSITLPMMAIGAHGIVSIASHIIGRQIKNMIESFVNGETSEAAKIHRDLFPVFKGLFITTNPVPLKAALNIMGMKVGGLRLPLVAATTDEQEKIKSMLTSHGII
ncbi:MAG: 4-hydroxy-tetrahydrodipicolinate synthase [Syntrophomonadaceae bacterium]|nr:4-hydroxy-tetrahydrodipicolinate synthase [Syntrophomonadaceae bacterium]